jgi:hypothetical protein
LILRASFVFLFSSAAFTRFSFALRSSAAALILAWFAAWIAATSAFNASRSSFSLRAASARLRLSSPIRNRLTVPIGTDDGRSGEPLIIAFSSSISCSSAAVGGMAAAAAA